MNNIVSRIVSSNTQVNRLATSPHTLGSGVMQQLVMQLREVIDSRIRFVELQTRRLLHERFLTDVERPQDLQDAMAFQPGIYLPESLNGQESGDLFDYIESLSRALYILERIKLSISEHNVSDVLRLLEDQRLLQLSDDELQRVLKTTD